MQANRITGVKNKDPRLLGDPDKVNYSKSNNFIIVDEQGIIEHINTNFISDFNKGKNLKSVEEIKSDPDISLIIQSMKFNKTEKLSLEILFYFVDGNACKDYRVQINRINIAGQTYYMLFLEENDLFKVFENKINTLQKALEEGNIPVLIADDNYKIKYATQNLENILSKGIEELYNKHIEFTLDRYLNDDEKVDLQAALIKKSKWSKVIELTDSKKNIHYYNFHIIPIQDSNFGRWNYILNAYNITDYVLRNRVLKKNEKRLRAIINNISDALFVVRKNGSSTHFEIGNNNFYNLFGIDKENFREDNFEDYLDYEISSTIIKSINLLETENLKAKKYNYYFGGLEKHFEINVTYVDDQFDLERFYIITLRDITDKEQYERKLVSAFAKEKELNKLKTLILHNMSHELRTPANAIMGYNDIIEDSIKEKDYETVHIISKSIKEILNKLISLFTNIIELSEIESGNFEIDKVKINCHQVLHSIYNKKFSDALSKNLEFTLELKEKELFIETDWVKFERVINALVDNAIKFTKKGKVILKSYLTQDNVVVEIIDTGEGIENEKIKEMLEPFAQEENFYTRSYEGSGLGLTIAYKLTKLMGGEFDITSSKFKGTKIQLTFPAIKVEAKKDFRLTNA